MPKYKKTQCFVIAATPLPLLGTPGYQAYYSSEAKIVHSPIDAMVFVTHGDAEEFAKEHEISLGAKSYISTITV